MRRHEPDLDSTLDNFRAKPRYTTPILVASLVIALASLAAGQEGTGAQATGPEALLDAGRIDDAWAAALERAESSGDHSQALAFSRRLGELTDHDQRIAFLEALLDVQPGNSPAALELGTLYKVLLRHELAVAALSRAEGPQNPVAQLNLASSFRALGQFDRAESVYDVLVGQARHRSFALAGLCHVHIGRGHLARCEEILQSLPEGARSSGVYIQADLLLAYVSRDDERLAGLLGRLEGGLGDWQSAIPALLAIEAGDGSTASQLIEARPGAVLRGEFSALRALATACSGDLAQARTLYNRAVELNPVFAEPEEAARRLLWRPPIAALAATLLPAPDGPGPNPPQDGDPAIEETTGPRSEIAAPRWPWILGAVALLIIGLVGFRRWS